MSNELGAGRPRAARFAIAVVLMSSVAMTSLGYLLPLMAATGAVDAPPEQWGNGFFADAAGNYFTHYFDY